MDKATEPKPSPAGGEPRQKDSKTSKLTIHEERTVTIMTPPQVVVQNLVIHPYVVSTVSVRPTAMALVGLAILAENRRVIAVGPIRIAQRPRQRTPGTLPNPECRA